MNISDPEYDYIIKVIQNKELMESEEFQQWIEIPENKQLFVEIMAYKEAVIRNKLKKENKKKIIRRTIAFISASAAIILLTLTFSLKSAVKDTQLNTPIRVFSSITNTDKVVIADDTSQQTTDDSIMNVSNYCCTKGICKATKQTVSTPRGKDFQIILSDGTKVWINAESSLTFPTSFDEDVRKVKLQGEACFEVTKDRNHPFIVEANGIETKVLGTKFNVRSYKESDRHVTLINGTVVVRNTQSQKEVLLAPGEDIAYTEGDEEIKSKVNTAPYIAWTEGLFYFEDESIETIMNNIGRWYNVNIDLQEKNISNIHLNFWANRNDGIDKVLNLLNRLGKIHADFTDNTIIIKHI